MHQQTTQPTKNFLPITRHRRFMSVIQTIYSKRLIVLLTLLSILIPIGRPSITFAAERQASIVTTPVTFSDTTPIIIEDKAQASPYPSTITVSGVGSICDVNVTLSGMEHVYMGDLEILVVSPTGGTVVLLSQPTNWNSDFEDVIITFDDEAAATVSTSSGLKAVSAGSYKPTDPDGNSFSGDSPAPSGPYGTELSALDALAGDGSWSLYVADIDSLMNGAINNGWSLEITPCAAPKINRSTPR